MVVVTTPMLPFGSIQASITLRRREVTRMKSLGRKEARWGLRATPVTRFHARTTWRSINLVHEMRVFLLSKKDQ
jgi:hypothetical protein